MKLVYISPVVETVILQSGVVLFSVSSMENPAPSRDIRHGRPAGVLQ